MKTGIHDKDFAHRFVLKETEGNLEMAYSLVVSYSLDNVCLRIAKASIVARCPNSATQSKFNCQLSLLLSFSLPSEHAMRFQHILNQQKRGEKMRNSQISNNPAKCQFSFFIKGGFVLIAVSCHKPNKHSEECFKRSFFVSIASPVVCCHDCGQLHC